MCPLYSSSGVTHFSFSPIIPAFLFFTE
jgi:hypothetical protein